MSADVYLANVLNREAVDTGPFSPIRQVQGTLHPTISQWAGNFLVSVQPSGSFAKGTANKSGTDIDLFISLRSDTSESLKEIYDKLDRHLQKCGFSPRRQNVSLNIKVGSFDVDLVPGKQQSYLSNDHSLYRRRADTWMKTNVSQHISLVRNAGRTSETRILKLWRNQKSLDFPSFYLELVTIEALKGRAGGLADNVWAVLIYLRDRFEAARFVDPANTNNVVSDDLTAADKAKIKAAAQRALAAKNWSEIVI